MPHARSNRFSSGREPFKADSKLHLQEATGPVRILNPTQAHFNHAANSPEGKAGDHVETTGRDEQKPTSDAVPDGDVRYRWTARNNRKGRHQAVISSNADANPGIDTPQSTTRARIVLQTILRMFTHYPVWDISWLVAYSFTWGSIVWVINAFFVWLPSVSPSSEFKNEVLSGGGITAFIGATIFEGGSILLVLEAINEDRAGCFGWAVRELVDEEKAGIRLHVAPALDGCAHHHSSKPNPFSGKDHSSKTPDSQVSWVWMPSWHDISTHYIHELGFLASFIQLIAATVFWISGFTALPGIQNKMSPGLTDGIYWTPQVVGGFGFIVSGLLFMLETQKRWYIPAPRVLGWHIGAWNTVGGLGFTLSPAFGYDTKSWAGYEAGLSTFWGSWAFLIGSSIQLYEALQKHPVEIDKGAPSSVPNKIDDVAQDANATEV